MPDTLEVVSMSVTVCVDSIRTKEVSVIGGISRLQAELKIFVAYVASTTGADCAPCVAETPGTCRPRNPRPGV